MRINHTQLIHGALLLALAFLTACGGGGGGAAPTTTTTTYTIGGTVSGLVGTVVLQNNGGNNLSVTANGSFTFTTKIATGAGYAVTVLTQPTGQTCTASSNTGAVSGANVTAVVVTCATSTVTIGGNITGLAGTVVLQNNGGNNYSTNANGGFTFTAPIARNAGYAVTVFTQPAGQRCTVTGGSGNANANITGVAVSCQNVFAINATVTGAPGSTGMVLQNTWNLTNKDYLSINTITGSSDTRTFSIGLTTGETYDVKVLIQPTAPAKTCSVTGGAGTMPSANVNVTITCSPPIPVYAYVANTAAGGVSVYEIGFGTGVLSAGSAVPAGTNPQAVTVDPTGRFAYVANQGAGINAGEISAYTIGASGALSQVNCSSVVLGVCIGSNYMAGDYAKSIIVDSSGKFVYAANLNSSDISAYTINASSGALTKINCLVGGGVCNGAQFPAGLKPTSIDADHTGKFLYVANADEGSVSAYTINATTGALTRILCGVGTECEQFNSSGANFLAGSGPQSVTVDPTSRFVYVANATDGTISAYSIDAVSGVLAPIDAVPATGVIDNFAAGVAPTSIAIDPSGQFAYVANVGNTAGNPGDISAYSIDAGTGKLSQIPCAGDATTTCDSVYFNFMAGINPTSITVDLLGQTVYVANYASNNVSAYTITGGGVLSQIDADTGVAGVQNFAAGTGPASVTTATIQ